MAAGAESLPQGLDDNVGVPLFGRRFFFSPSLLTQGHWEALMDETFIQGLLAGAVVNGVSGSVGLFSARGECFRNGGWFHFGDHHMGPSRDGQGYLLLLNLLLFLGTALTKLGYQKKAERELAQEGGGRRGARHALANTGTATFCALLVATTDQSLLFRAGASLAPSPTAAADTAGSEIGQLWGASHLPDHHTQGGTSRYSRRPSSLEGNRCQPRGRRSPWPVLGAGVGLYPWLGAGLVTLAAFTGAILESLVGGGLSRSGAFSTTKP